MFFRFAFSIIHESERASENGERPGNTYHLNDVWWTCRGAEPNYKLVCNNDRVSFLPVKSSTVNLMNVWGDGYAIAGVLNDEV